MPDTGDFAVMATSGWKARVIRWVTRSPVNHAVLHVGDGQIVEAQPHGARLSPAATYPAAIWSAMSLTAEQRASIAVHGRSHVGAPYSWLDDAAIALADVFGRKLPLFIRRRLSRPDRLQCAQLVDLSYHEAGIHLFTDGRLFGDVAPADLYQLIESRSEVTSDGHTERHAQRR